MSIHTAKPVLQNNCSSFSIPKIERNRKLKLFVSSFKLNFLKPYKHVQIQINNISGQQIKASSYQDVNKEVRIDLSQYPAGIYIINIIADGKRLSPKKAIRG